jgi:hypothetical protein
MSRDRSKPHSSRRSSAGLKVADVASCVSLVVTDAVTIAPRIVAAREQTWSVLTAVGCGASVLRSVLSRVMGEEQNIREWCATYRVADHQLSQGQTVGAR